MQEYILNKCSCGEDPIMTEYFLKGVANRKNYFVKCPFCMKRTRSRKRYSDAIQEWNQFEDELYKTTTPNPNSSIYKEVLFKLDSFVDKNSEMYGNSSDTWKNSINDLVAWLDMKAQ